MSETRYTEPVPASKVGMRFDRFLADSLGGLSRTRLRVLIEAGHVRDGDGHVLDDPSAKVIADQVFAVEVPPASAATPEPQNIPLDIVFEDDALLVINKPRGLVVHPAPGNHDQTLVNALLYYCGDSLSGIGGVMRPGIVHRLDKDTSGLIVVAKTDLAHQGLSQQLQDRTLKRVYHTVVWGLPSPKKGVIEGNIGRNPKNRKKMAVVRRGGKEARTHYEVLKTFGTRASLVECRLETGRTHQIRVHLASISHPVVGDPLYGTRRAKGGPRGGRAGASFALDDRIEPFLKAEEAQVLHAHEVRFRHPKSGEDIELYSEYPLYFSELIKNLECG